MMESNSLSAGFPRDEQVGIEIQGSELVKTNSGFKLSIFAGVFKEASKII